MKSKHRKRKVKRWSGNRQVEHDIAKPYQRPRTGKLEDLRQLIEEQDSDEKACRNRKPIRLG